MLDPRRNPKREGSRISLVQSALLVGLIMTLPALAVGFCNDDFLHRLILEGKVPILGNRWWSLYDFTPPHLTIPKIIDSGFFPWYTTDDLSLRFFRPLSSALLAAEHHLFGRNAFILHVHSLLWFLLLVAVVAHLYEEWFNRNLARFAAIIYASAGLHAMSTAWIAARHANISSALSLLAFYFRVKTKEIRFGKFYSVCLLALAFFAGETSLAILPFFIIYEWAQPEPSRLKRVAPWVGFGVGYLGLYSAFGFGAHHSGMYVSPLSDPGRFISIAGERLPLLLGQLFLAIPSEIPTAFPQTKGVLIRVGLAGTFVVLATAWFLRKGVKGNDQHRLIVLLIAALLSLPLALSTSPGGRLLPIALFGTAPISAFLLIELYQRRRSLLYLPLVLLAAVTTLVLSPAWRFLQTASFFQFGQTQKQIAEEANFKDCTPPATMFLLTGADPSLSLYADAAIAFHYPNKSGKLFHLLSSAPSDQRFYRLGRREFILEVMGRRVSNEFERLFSDRSLPVGFERHLNDFSVRLEATEGGHFTKVRFHFADDPDSQKSCFLIWKENRLTSIPPPALGESILVRHERGPMGL
jgi:hypothetical protein